MKLLQPAYTQAYPLHFDIAFVWVMQLLGVLIVFPVGNFPLNDDWAYAHSVQWLLSEHRVRLSNWIAMTLLPQTLIGGAWASAFGASFESLRVLTLMHSLATSALLVVWFRMFSENRLHVLLCTICIIATPWWWPLSLSFMTEFYAWAWMLAAMILALKLNEAKRTDQSMAYWVGFTVCCVISVLQRQTALAVPAAFAIAYFMGGQKRGIRTITRAALPLCASVGAYLFYTHYLRATNGVPDAQGWTNTRLIERAQRLASGNAETWRQVAAQLFVWLGYISFALFGALIAFSMSLVREHWRAAIALCVVLTFIGLTTLTAFHFPFKPDNLIDPLGIGPYTLGNGLVTLEQSSLDRTVGVWGLLIAWLLIPSIALLLLQVNAAVKVFLSSSAQAKFRVIFLVAALVTYSTPFLVTDFFDRYALIALPFLLPFFLVAQPRLKIAGRAIDSQFRFAACTSVAVQFLWSCIATHDYFAWNRARWELISAAQLQGATPQTLDGGFEYNGWNAPNTASPLRGSTANTSSWWWVEKDEWIVAFASQSGTGVVARAHVNGWLPSTPPELVLVKRK
jgi:hypothetical protein